MIRTGFGYDAHPLVAGRPLVIGGITVPYHKGAEGHSDADVLIHAIMDALLGAAGMRDIGYHFPDRDTRYKNMDSKRLLAECMAMIRQRGFEPGNVDATVCLQNPEISGHIADMQQVLTETMGVNNDQVSVKATTTEHMGFVGRGEGVAAYAVALLIKSTP